MRYQILFGGLAVAAMTSAAMAQAPAPSTPTQASPTPASPTQAPRVPFRDRFAAANTTHDGCLTQAQAEAGGMRPVARNFAQIDVAHRGCVTLQDIRAFTQQRRAAGAQPGQNPQPPTAPPPQ
jgi:hypothetical protein